MHGYSLILGLSYDQRLGNLPTYVHLPVYCFYDGDVYS